MTIAVLKFHWAKIVKTSILESVFYRIMTQSEDSRTNKKNQNNTQSQQIFLRKFETLPTGN